MRAYRKLTKSEQQQFRHMVKQLVEDLNKGQGLAAVRPSLRCKRFQSKPGWQEITWAKDGRALFRVGEEVKAGEIHIEWLAVGTHDIFDY